MAKDKNKFYVVWKGRRTGVFSNWKDVLEQVQGFPGAQFRSFDSMAAARRALDASPDEYRRPSAPRLPGFATNGPILQSIAVDAACSGNPGPVEYRAIMVDTGKMLFHRGPFADGTNNVGEFLAIVEALRLCRSRGIDWPIYSDSANALKWVKEKKCRTNLVENERNHQLFRRIARAESWLARYSYPNPVLKWRTEEWGEIPADYGRK
ncbi:MAG: viroplasmin family protein [Rudaea sp.]